MTLDDLSKKIRQFGQDTMTEVQKMNEVRQLNSKIGTEKNKIHSVYTEIGRKLYNMYKEDPLQGFEAEIQELASSFGRIDELQAQIRTVKGVRLCPHCKSEVNAAEHFCPNCGSKMPEDYTVEHADILEAYEEVSGCGEVKNPEEPAEGEESGDVENSGQPANLAEADAEEQEPEEPTVAEDAVDLTETEAEAQGSEEPTVAEDAGQPAVDSAGPNLRSR